MSQVTWEFDQADAGFSLRRYCNESHAADQELSYVENFVLLLLLFGLFVDV